MVEKNCENCKNAHVWHDSGSYWDPPSTEFDCRVWNEMHPAVKAFIQDYDAADCMEKYPLVCEKFEVL